MGKVMRHTLGASLNIRHNLSSSKGPKPLQLKLLTTYIPKRSEERRVGKEHSFPTRRSSDLIWTAPLPPETELSRQMTTSTTSIDIIGLQAAYANLHTDQERDYFMQRYHDVISSFGGKTSYDADNRPLLVMRSN